MQKAMNTLETVTFANFDYRGYLLANPDLKAAGLTSEKQLLKHFSEFGHAENRLQVVGELLRPSEYRRLKLERFLHVLAEDVEPQVLPLSVGSAHHSLDDYLSESANEDCGPFVADVEENPGKIYLDIGCGFRKRVYANVLYLEVYPSITADIIVPPNAPYPIQSDSFDGIVCAAVLEHVRRPWEAVREIARILKPGGKVFIDWPFLQPVHGFPGHYFNATREGLRSVFEDNGITVRTIGTFSHQTPDHTITWVLNSLMNGISDPKLKERLAKTSVGDLLAQTPGSGMWRQILAIVPERVKSEIACGNFMIGEKAT